MKVLGYGRISNANDQNETSLDNQRELYEEYVASDEDLTNEGWYQDRNVSGDTPVLDRPEFQVLVDHLREDQQIEIVLVKNSKRLSREDLPDEIEAELKDEIGREVVFGLVKPEPLDEMAEAFAGERGTNEWAVRPVIQGLRKFKGRQDIVEAKQHGKMMYKKYGQHRPPRGIKYNDDREFVPVEEYRDDDGNRIRHKEFDVCIQMLNEMATTGLSPYQVGKEHGVPYPDRKMKNLWKRREVYRVLAERNRPSSCIEF